MTETAQMWSPEAELAVLGGMFIDADAAQRMADELSPLDFYRPQHRCLFAAMVRLIGRGEVIDGVTLHAELTGAGDLEKAGGMALISGLYDAVPSAANIEYHAGILRDHAHRRELKKSLEASLATVLHPEGRSVPELQELVERDVMRVGDGLRSTAGLVSVKPLLMAEFEAIEAMMDGKAGDTIGTGLIDLDRKTTGSERGDLVLVAARPSMGKSSLAVGNIIAHNAIGQNRRVALFSLETKRHRVVRRLLASEARVDMQKAKRRGQLDEHDLVRLSSAAAAINTAPLFVDDTAGATCQHLRASLRRLVNEGGPVDVVVVDFLGKMRVPGANSRNEEVGQISAELKDVAMDFDCVVFALSQLNRAVEQRPDKKPMMSDLRDSGSLEQDADGVLLLFRPEYYFGATDKKGNSLEGKAEVIVGKWRDGETGTVHVVYEKEFTKFSDAYPRAYGVAS